MAETRKPMVEVENPMIEIHNIRAGYGETVVLEEVALSLPERGTLAVLGRNGVGKTTLLATLMGHTTRHSGRIVFRGREIQHLAVHERCRLGLGYVPQAREIFPSLTVEENLTVAARASAGREAWTLQRVYGLFPRLAERRAHMGNQISGGEQQMLAIGRALMGNPALLLMDEPLEGLAPVIVEMLLKALRRLIAEESLAIVLVEQSARLALEMTEAALVLDRGRVAYSGRSADLLSDPKRLAALFVAQ
jgi:branched-chain amino acid transport system ATP-binding protein